MIPARSEPAATEAPPASVNWALAGLSLSMLLPSLGVSIANVALPTLAQAFNAPFQQIQWVVLAYLLTLTTLIVSAGRLGDIFGRRRLLLGGILLFTVASVLCGIAPTLWLLIGARALQGAGAAVMMALTMALARGAVPTEKTGAAMGLLGTMSAVGTALGPSLGGILISALGWRAIFLIGAPLGLLTFFFAFRCLPADRPASKSGRASIDPVGILLLAATLAAYALAVTLGRENFGWLNVALLSAAAIGAALFMFAEGKVESPLINLAMLRDATLAANLAMSAIVASVAMTTLVVGPFYLSSALGLNPAHVGFVLSVGPLVSASVGIPAGRLTDRFGAPAVIVLGLVGMALGALALSMTQVSLGIAGYIVPLVVLTAGYALFQAANNTAVMANVTADRRGVVSGVLNLSRNLGLITGASVMGAVFALASATDDLAGGSAQAVAGGLHVTFAVAAGLLVVALAMAVGRFVAAARSSLPGNAS
jgi:EmrB/QacA subfamily drug resistance transporter